VLQIVTIVFGYCIATLNDVSYTSCVSGTSLAAPFISAVSAMCLTVKPLNEPAKTCKKYDKTAYGRVDMWGSTWYYNCSKYNFENSNNRVDSQDAQKLANKVNQPSLYNVLYDIYPVGTDGVINISDALSILFRGAWRCQ
jgi:hypothetical protein